MHVRFGEPADRFPLVLKYFRPKASFLRSYFRVPITILGHVRLGHERDLESSRYTDYIECDHDVPRGEMAVAILSANSHYQDAGEFVVKREAGQGSITFLNLG